MNRFDNLNSHPWYGPIINRVRESEVERMRRFIEEHNHLGANEFVEKINSTFARGGNRDDSMASELLTVANFEGFKR